MSTIDKTTFSSGDKSVTIEGDFFGKMKEVVKSIDRLSNSFVIDLRMRGFSESYGPKKVKLVATLEGDVPVDCGQWEATRGRPFGFIEVLDKEGAVLWEFIRPPVSVGRTTTVQLRWEWSTKVPADPDRAITLQNAMQQDIVTVSDVLTSLFGERVIGETLEVRFYLDAKEPKGSLI